MKKIHILLLNNVKEDLELIESFFQIFKPEIKFTSNANEALIYLKTVNPTLTMISLSLARENNWYFLKNINYSLMPIIGLVEKKYSCWMKEGRAYGIDAYIIKPLDYLNIKTYLPSILSHVWASKKNLHSLKERRHLYDRRITEVGRRWYDQMDLSNEVVNKSETKDLKNIGPFDICTKKKFVYRNGKELKLSPTEFKLFILLFQYRDQVISVNEIITNIWNEDSRASEEDVKQYIYMLRKKIEENPSKPKLILNHKGFGYMLATVKQQFGSSYEEAVRD